MDWLFDATQIVIFVSYFVISCIVGYVYIRHKNYIDTCVNRLLLVTAALFLMLCALTHLYAVWFPEPSAILLFLCALVSLVAAVCTVYTFRGLDDYLRLRIKTIDLMREETIMNLTKGYDLNVRVSGSTILDGVAGSYRVSEPQFIAGGFRVNDTVRVGEHYFRVANIVEPFVQMNDNKSHPEGKESSLERGDSSEAEAFVTQVYGYDATAEVHMRDESERMNRMKMDMCMSTAHHVRTPLSCLGIALSCMRSRLDTVESFNLLEEAIAHTEMINLVVTQFVDVASFDSSLSMEPVVEYVDIRSLVERAENVVARVSTEGVVSTFTIGDCVPRLVLTDAACILQILLNLVTNAAKYTFVGCITLSVTFEAGMLVIISKDTGVGIPDCDKLDIFEKNFTKDTTGDHDVVAAIGLFSVKRKLGLLGGKYEILDNPGGGTILVVHVPVEVDRKCFLRHGKDRKEKLSAQVVQVRSILVVDDTPSVRKIMQRHLRGHVIDVAVNGAEGLAKMKEKKYDIVLLDIMMPVLDGRGCLKQFREWEKSNRPASDHQVVFCVSATSVELDLGFDGSIPKPVDTKRLHEVLQELD